MRAMDSGVLDAARSSMSIFGYEAPPHAEAVRTLIVIISGVDSMGKRHASIGPPTRARSMPSFDP